MKRAIPRAPSRRAVRNTLAVYQAMHDNTTPVIEQAPVRQRTAKPRAEREAGVADAIKDWRKTRPDVRLWRQNVGEFRLANGVYFRAGLCNGSSDFVGIYTFTITPAMVGKQVGAFFALELKRPGELPEPHQQAWLEEVRDAGAISGVATSVDDAEAVLARWVGRMVGDER